MQGLEPHPLPPLRGEKRAVERGNSELRIGVGAMRCIARSPSSERIDL